MFSHFSSYKIFIKYLLADINYELQFTVYMILICNNDILTFDTVYYTSTIMYVNTYSEKFKLICVDVRLLMYYGYKYLKIK